MNPDSDIAIVGMAGRFPGARDLAEFWRNLDRGVESIARLTDREMLEAGVPPALLARDDYVKAAPVIDGPDRFDAAFFGYTAPEAAVMDPQHRWLLELSHAALEDAGCDPARYPGRAGVFAGSALNTYFSHAGLGDALAESYIPTLIANDKDFLATRISYQLGLRGPSLTVQTACSTSLVALHLARQSLLSEETDLALAGAVSIRVPHRAGYLYDGSGVVSRDGHVRAFDAAANGTVFGSGAGVVVLKRLADALAAGDRVYAIVKGSAVNNDGGDKAAYTAPSVNGQAEAIVEALANAEVDAASLSYVEAHGSGTPVGDRIELLALTRAFRTFTARSGFCAVGSVKTNVGHLDAAAGMAGLIKTALALHHRRLPASLNFTRPNDEIDFPATPFFVNAEAHAWEHDAAPRRAGVMATGMGGTNAFVVLEEAPPVAPAAPPATERSHLLLVSAKTPTALDAAARQLADFLADEEPGDEAARTLPEIAHTLQTGRRFFAQRRFAVCRNRAEAEAALRGQAPGKVASGAVSPEGAPPVAFLLPGVGDHYAGMGRELYRDFETFRREVDRCAEILRPLLGEDLRAILFPAHGEAPPAGPAGAIDLKRMLGRAPVGTAPGSAGTLLEQTRYNQPALFAIEYALARQWMHWGVRPARLIGHSLGEYVAACLAGVFSLEDALHLIAARAALVSELPRASMLAVMLSEAELLPLLEAGLSIALINGPQLCVVAGPVGAMDAFESRLKQRGTIFRPVRNRHAFHSRLLDPIVEPFAAQVGRIKLSPPRIPFVSNVTGTWITGAQAVDPRYWAEHARSTARFSDALAQLWQLPEHALVEVGPGRTLGVLATQHPARPRGRTPLIVPSLRPAYENQPDADVLLHAVGRLWLAGVDLAWDKFQPDLPARKIALPTYPFERQSFWLEPRQARPAPSGQFKPDLADWFYVPAWRRTGFPSRAQPDENATSPLWLIVADEPAFAEQLCQLLVDRDADVVVARFGTAPARKNEDAWEIRPAVLDDSLALVTALKSRAHGGLNVLHLGAISPRVKTPGTGHDALNDELGLHSVMALVQALGEKAGDLAVRLAVVTAHVHEVTGDEILNPAGSMAAGLCGVISKEYPGTIAFSVDLPATTPVEACASRLLDEFSACTAGAVIAYRGKFRWERFFRPERLPAVATGTDASALSAQGLRSRGVYLITGGTGGLGLSIARHLAQTCQARLILVKKSPLPAKTEWESCLATNTLPEADRAVIQALLELEAFGGKVEVHACDVADHAGLRRIVHEALARHGALHGVIHAAGILREGLLQLNTREAVEDTLRSKTLGTLALFDVVRDLKPDLFVLFSSLSSVAAYHGQSDYVAANAFLDAFTHYANAHADFPTIAINWPAWRETGLLTREKARAGLERRHEAARRHAILTKDGVEAFRRIVAHRPAQVIVSPRELDVVLTEAAAPISEGKPPSPSPATAAAAPRAGAVIDPPRDEVEQAVAEIWSETLGLTPLGVHEKFLDLGGHSLLAMRIVAQIRRRYQIDYTLRQFFESPTVAGTALAIQTAIITELEMTPETAARSSSS